MRGRDWPAISALIDMTIVVDETVSTGRGDIVQFLALLTYFYRNPELQSGEYRRVFDDGDEAQACANSYKGSTFKVHVDPRDPARSVLRKEDL